MIDDEPVGFNCTASKDQAKFYFTHEKQQLIISLLEDLDINPKDSMIGLVLGAKRLCQ